jgi:hypothetical protein
MAYTTKLPARGDKVIDTSRVIKQEGYIKSGIFDKGLTPSDGEDRVKSAFVEFSHADTAWYTVEQLQDRWDEDKQAYILEG